MVADRVSSAVLLLLPLMATGCAQLEKEAGVVDACVIRLHSDTLEERQGATTEILHRESVSMCHLVIPRLALESARVPLEVSSRAGNIFTGRVTGGNEKALEVEVTDRVLQGAVVSIPLDQVKTIRLFEP